MCAALTPPSLEQRRLAIASALRAVSVEPATAVAAPAVPPVPAYPEEHELAAIRADVRRLSERVERVEGKVDLIRDGDDAPLAWPVAVGGESTLDVPPVEIGRRNSPAFDVLMGPPPG